MFQKTNFTKVNWFGILIFLYSLWIFNIRLRDENGFDDFNVFYNAGRRLLNHENIYSEPYFLNLYKYYYSVFFALLLSFLQSISLLKIKLVWFFINYLAIIRTLFILKKNVFQNFKYSNVLFAFFLILISKIVLFNFLSNQLTILIAWMILESYIQIKQEKYVLPALLLCVGVNFKLLPLAVLPWLIFICKERARLILFFSTFILAMLVLPAVFIGWNYNYMLIGEWLKTINPFSNIHIMQTNEGGMLDISSLCTKYFTAEKIPGENEINFLVLSKKGLFVLVNLIRALLLSLVVYLAYKLNEKTFGIQSSLIVLFAFMTLIPLCFPHQRLYSYFMMAPMLSVLIVAVYHNGHFIQKSMLTFLLLLSGLLTWVDFTGDLINNFFNLYRLPTIGTSFLLIFYVYFILEAQFNTLKTNKPAAGSN